MEDRIIVIKEYLLLFTDSLVSNLVINLDSELIVHIMKKFDIYTNSTILIVAILALLVAISINYFLGLILIKILIHCSNSQQIYVNQALLSQFFEKYNMFILWLIIIPLWGEYIPFIAGFARTKFLKVLSVSILSKLFYYIYIIYLS